MYVCTFSSGLNVLTLPRSPHAYKGIRQGAQRVAMRPYRDELEEQEELQDVGVESMLESVGLHRDRATHTHTHG